MSQPRGRVGRKPQSEGFFNGFFGDEDFSAFVLLVGEEDLFIVVAAPGVDFPGGGLEKQERRCGGSENPDGRPFFS